MITLMIVDDMPIFREPIAASLRLAGYKTVTAADGKEALAKAAEHHPQLILLDLAMPVMDGITFLGEFRALPGMEKVPVILLTALSQKDRIVQAARLGVRDCMLKSQFSLRELQERIRKYVGDAEAPPEAGAVIGKVGAVETKVAARSIPVAAASPAAMPRGPGVAAMPPEHAAGTPERAHSPAFSHPAAAPIPLSPPGQPLALRRLLTREECVTRVHNCLQTHSLTGVVAQVAAMAASPRGDASDLAAMIARDPVLTARVLQVANSSAYVSPRGPATSVQESVRRVGCAAIRNIAVIRVPINLRAPSGATNAYLS